MTAPSSKAQDVSGTQEVRALPLHKWAARHLVFLSIVTVGLHLVALHMRKAIFGGGTGWLTFIKYVTWSERLGLLLTLLTLSIALCGAWLFAWLRIAKWRDSHSSRALMCASISWCMLLTVDFFVRQKGHEMLGTAFNVMDFAAGVASWKLLAKNTWSWFGEDILYGLATCVACGLACYGLLRLLRNEALSWGLFDRLSVRATQAIVATAFVCSLLFFTVFAHTWPTTRELLAEDTLLGLPFQLLVSSLTDFDRDGYSQFDSPADTEPFDGKFHPYAVDVPDDGLDQDLLMGDLKIGVVSAMMREKIDRFGEPPSGKFTNRMNVIYITLESVRFDALTKVMGGKRVMPHLRSLIDQRGAIAPQHVYASKGFTSSSITQLFWGGFFEPKTTLVDDFKSNDYFVGTFSGYDIKQEGFEEENGLTRGDLIFDPRYDKELGKWHESIPASRLARHIAAFIGDYDRKQPFFLYVHLMDPHFPYNQTNPFVLADGPISRARINRDNKEELTRIYLNQVYHVDKAVGRIIEALEAKGVLGNTLLFFISDHGESLFDDNLLLGHGTAINEVMTRCAAVIYNSPINVEDVFSHCDVRKMIARMLTSKQADKPRLITVPGRHILHYLGWIENPSRIGLFSLEKGRLWYDFKQDLAFDEARNLQQLISSSTVDPVLLKRTRALIQAWEYLQYTQVKKE